VDGDGMTSDDDRIRYLSGDDPADAFDDEERAELDDLRDLLADPSVWAEPEPWLEDAVVAAVSDAAERGRDRAPVATSRARRSVSRLRTIALAGAAAVVVFALVLASRDTADPDLDVALGGTELVPGAEGYATFSETDAGWRIELDASGLPRLDGGRFYQAWLVDDAGVAVTVGTFNEPDDVVLWAGVSPEEFTTIAITEEEADGDPASSGRRVLVGTIAER
jgi:hypothetical protein